MIDNSEMKSEVQHPLNRWLKQEGLTDKQKMVRLVATTVFVKAFASPSLANATLNVYRTLALEWPTSRGHMPYRVLFGLTMAASVGVRNDFPPDLYPGLSIALVRVARDLGWFTTHDDGVEWTITPEEKRVYEDIQGEPVGVLTPATEQMFITFLDKDAHMEIVLRPMIHRQTAATPAE